MAVWNDNEKNRISGLIFSAEITGAVAWYKSVLVPKILKNKERYRVVAEQIGCPLAMLPLLHTREMGSDVGVFKAYLGNGQPISQKTTIVPVGRGPWISWESGAIDALIYDGIDKIKDWSLERMLFELEGFNGYGYRKHGIHSPYVWSFTNHYKRGHYTRDGHYSPSAIDENIGCFALYKFLVEADSEFQITNPVPPVDVINLPDNTEPGWIASLKKWIIDLFEKYFGSTVPAVADVPAPDPEPLQEPKWLTVARGEIGQKEIVGSKHNPRVLEYHDATSLSANDDETAWCSSFANWCLKQAGIQGTNSAWARDWLNWGEKISVPVLGCIVVRERNGVGGDSHVYFYTGPDKGIGGNQSNMVSESKQAGALLGYRWPRKGSS